MSTSVEPTPKGGLSITSFAPAARYVFLVVVAAIIIVPIAVSVIGGFKTNQDLQSHPGRWPSPFIFSNYGDIVSTWPFWQKTINSVIVMLLTTVIVLSLSSAAAFVFSRIQFRGRETLFNFFVLGLLFPLPVAILPLYLLLRSLNLTDSLWGVILPQVAFGLPFNILLLRTFFAAVPRDLEDAAYVDGATPIQFLTRILLPLVRPALAAVAVIAMVGSWNNFFLPLVILNSERLYTLPLGVQQFQGEFMTDWAKVLAYVSLALVPAVAFYLVAERHIVTGLTAGSVKG
ncbi:MAG TPA: carbohydrate ABC transporter permease [Thermomicrobiales bacterium]|nr:carbohydrate ABC transporter permease [Thermomicrobiales bacterium]